MEFNITRDVILCWQREYKKRAMAASREKDRTSGPFRCLRRSIYYSQRERLCEAAIVLGCRSLGVLYLSSSIMLGSQPSTLVASRDVVLR